MPTQMKENKLLFEMMESMFNSGLHSVLCIERHLTVGLVCEILVFLF